MEKGKKIVTLQSIFESSEWQNSNARLPLALGKDADGNIIVPDLTQMPNLLIGSMTHSGQSVCMYSIILGLLKKYSPAELKFIMADLKVVELCDYKNLPHLQFPILTEHKEILHSLNWCIEEMHRRYMILASSGCQQLYDYNKISNKKFPYIVFILDELSDLMVNDNTLAEEVKNAIAKICQKGHAVGIYMIISTQRPSYLVIPPKISRHISGRLVFRTASDTCKLGAETLYTCGDMLAFFPPNRELIQIQELYASYEYMEQIIASVTPQLPNQITPLDLPIENIDLLTDEIKNFIFPGDTYGFLEAVKFVMSTGKTGTRYLKEHLHIDYNHAAEYMVLLRERGVIKN